MKLQKQNREANPASQYYMPVGNSKKITGYIPMDNMIPIQTEVDELIVLPTNDVVKVNAKKRHSRMPEDQVTDIVPDGSYILSQYGDVDIYKKEADQIIIESQNRPYNLYSKNSEPKVRTLGDIMTKNKMKPADLARKVLAKYKTVDHDDPFTEQTNRANKYTASKYLQGIVALSELDKERKGLNAQEQVDMYQQQPEAIARQGGMLRSMLLRMAQDGGGQGGAFMDYLPSIVSGVGALTSGLANRRLLNKREDEALSGLSSMYQQQRGLENLNLGANLAGVMLQDPRVEMARKSAGQSAAALRNANLAQQQERDYLMGRMAANRADLSSMPPQVAAQLMAQQNASIFDNMSKVGLEAARDRAQREIEAAKLEEEARNFNQAAGVAERMGLTSNANRNLATAAGAVSGSIGNLQNLGMGEYEAEQGIKNQGLATRMSQNRQGYQDALNTMALYEQTRNSRAYQKQLQDYLNSKNNSNITAPTTDQNSWLGAPFNYPTNPQWQGPPFLNPQDDPNQACIRMPNGQLINRYTNLPC